VGGKNANLEVVKAGLAEVYLGRLPLGLNISVLLEIIGNSLNFF
jgi:hypothetical protein